MRLLLDTHVVLWCMSGDRRLGKRSAALVRDPANDVYYSAASIWEMAIKSTLGKLRVDAGELLENLAAAGFRELPVLGPHAAATAALPQHHRDPFDRLLVAQSLAECMPLLTSDRALAAYGPTVMLAG